MAIDSAEKRRAVAALAFGLFIGPGVTPNASPDQEWRQVVGYGYPGILADAPVASVLPLTGTPFDVIERNPPAYVIERNPPAEVIER